MNNVDRRSIFGHIYAAALWKRDQSLSGAGSDPEAAAAYVSAVEKLVHKLRPTRVLDIGHGDWVMWPKHAFEGVQYLGLDVAAGLSELVSRKHGTPDRQFMQLDAVTQELPDADLVLIKEVLQHLSNEDVYKLLSKLDKYKHIFICSDVLKPGWRLKRFANAMTHVVTGSFTNCYSNFFGAVSRSLENIDICTGDYRPLNLEKPPWNLAAMGFTVEQSQSLPHPTWSRHGLDRRTILLRGTN